jgi:Cu+-exporting ATPase
MKGTDVTHEHHHEHDHDHEHHHEHGHDPDLATDPVCGMSVDPATAGPAGLSLDHAGTTYFFCGKGCLLDFRDDPAHYLDPSYTPSM